MIRRQKHGFVPQMLWIFAGPLIWFANFNLAYGAAGFGFRFGLTPFGFQLIAWSSTVASIILLIVLIGRTRWQRTTGAVEFRDIAQWLDCLSLAATVFHAMALWIVAV